MHRELKIMMVGLFLAVMMSSCVKEGDFEALKHPIEIQGDFDPVFGLPIAKMSADMNTFINMFDSVGRWSVTVNDNGIVSLNLSDTMRAKLNWSIRKGKAEQPKLSGDTIFKHIIISGTQTTNLFNTLQTLNLENVSVDHLITNVDADAKAYLSETFDNLLDRGIHITFDSMTFEVACVDGHSEMLKTESSNKKYDLQDIKDGCNILILKNSDMGIFTIHKPMYVLYRIRMNLAIPLDQWITNEEWLNLDDIGVDSVTAEIHTNIEMPLTFASSQFSIDDTMNVNLAKLDSSLAQIRGYVNLGNNEGNYLALAIDNGLPVGISFGAALLDESGNPITDLTHNDTILKPASIMPSADGSTYIAKEPGKSIIKLSLNQSLLDNLAKTRSIGFHIEMQTTDGAIVSILPENKVDVRAYIVVSPHVSFHTDPIGIDIPLIK